LIFTAVDSNIQETFTFLRDRKSGGGMSDKPTVFISYSRDNRKWREILYPYLKALALADHLVLWDDGKIDMGADLIILQKR
jgi:hypothetical protein